MTTTYDPTHPAYLAAPDLRAEMTRVFDICHGCRLCFNLCPAFPSLFEMIDAKDGAVGELTAAEQDRVVDECYQCKLCYLKCPYVPPHEWALDFPRLMMRARAVRHATPGRPLAEPLVNAVTGTPGTLARKVMEASVGVAAGRVLPPYARERFSTWVRRRPSALESPRAEVSVFPTCFIEYMEPAIGRALVGVYERNRVACSLPAGARCCGAPWLHGGDVERFRRAARRNVAVLAREVRAGRDVIVAQPTCAYVVKKDYPIYAPGTDADLVAAHTFDPAEHLVALHRREGLDTEFTGPTPSDVAYHRACHLRAEQQGARGKELLELLGAKVSLIERCSGIDGTWGYRRENYELARRVARPLARAVEESGDATVCGDCHLANSAIREETGRRPLHPVQLLARAYGIEGSE